MNIEKESIMVEADTLLSKEFYTVEQVAELLQVSRQTVYNWINEGALKAFKAGRTTRITKEALEAFLRPVEPVQAADKGDV